MMLEEFSFQIERQTTKKFPWCEYRIKYVPTAFRPLSANQLNNSCLAHVINLATQALISTYSPSPHFDPGNPEAHIPTTRDEVGLIRTISVKVSSLSFLMRHVKLTQFAIRYLLRNGKGCSKQFNRSLAFPYQSSY